jgi:hypothetical protein
LAGQALFYERDRVGAKECAGWYATAAYRSDDVQHWAVGDQGKALSVTAS